VRSNSIITTWIVISLTSLGGCGVRSARHYLLDLPVSARPVVEVSAFQGPVAVREFTAPRFLQTGAIVYRQSPEKLDFYDFHRWAEDPRRMVTQSMVGEMRARKFFQSVNLFDGRNSSEWIVAGRLNHLEEVDEGESVSVQVEIAARLFNSRTGEEIWQGNATRKSRLSQRTVPGVVASLSHEVSSAVQELVSSMETAVNRTGPRQ
jgi:uncharacterized lipoprotein YmbA